MNQFKWWSNLRVFLPCLILTYCIIPIYSGAVVAEPKIDSSQVQVRQSPQTLQLNDALALALEFNPDLMGVPLSLRAGEARSLQSSLRPNPDLSVSAENLPASGYFDKNDQFQNTIQLSQLIELGDKRPARMRVAAAESDLIYQHYQTEKVRVLSETAANFIHLLSDQKLLSLAAKGTKLCRETLDSIRLRIRAGSSSVLEEKRAEIALARAEIEEEHVEHELITSHRNLAAIWSDEAEFTNVDGDFFAIRTLPSYQQVESLLESGPELKLQELLKKAREAELLLARTKTVPNITASLGLRHGRTSEDTSGVFGFTVPLQIFDRGQGYIAEAEANKQLQTVSAKSVRSKLKSVLFGLYQEMKHGSTQTKVLTQTIIPASQAALRIAKKGFAEGQFSYPDFLDAQATSLEVEKEYIDAAKSYHRYRLEIEKLLGGPLDQVQVAP